MSLIGGKVSQSDVVFSNMRKAGKDLDARARAVSDAKSAREEIPERITHVIVGMTMSCRSAVGEADSGRLKSVDLQSLEDKLAASALRPKPKPSLASSRDEGSEVVDFGEALRDADMARASLDRERLDFERKRLERELAARKKDEAQNRKIRRSEPAWKLISSD